MRDPYPWPPLLHGGWGGQPVPDRVREAIAWSAVAPCPPTGNPTSDANATQILKFVSPDGSPHKWAVSLSVVPTNDTQSQSEDPLVVPIFRFTRGALHAIARVDLVHGDACYQVMADSIDIGVLNQRAVGTAPIVMQAAISPADGGQHVRPRRTILFTIPIAPGTEIVEIPRWAQEFTVQVFRSVSVFVEILDRAGNFVGGGRWTQDGSSPPYMLDLPNGAAVLRVSQNDNAPTPAAALFRLGF